MPDSGAVAQRVEQIMGMPIVIDVPDAPSGGHAVDAAFARLREVDRVFSTYREDSDVCRLNRGEITLAEAHPDVAGVLAQCDQLTGSTGGYFDVRGLLERSASQPDPVDPSGLVKGWAVERAGAILDAAGVRRWCINAGGDVLLRGRPQAGEGWRVGIRHPLETESLAAVVEVRGRRRRHVRGLRAWRARSRSAHGTPAAGRAFGDDRRPAIWRSRTPTRRRCSPWAATVPTGPPDSTATRPW